MGMGMGMTEGGKERDEMRAGSESLRIEMCLREKGRKNREWAGNAMGNKRIAIPVFGKREMEICDSQTKQRRYGFARTQKLRR